MTPRPEMPEIVAVLREIPADEAQSGAALLVEWSEDETNSPRVREALAQLAVALGGLAHGIDPGETLAFLNQADIGRN